MTCTDPTCGKLKTFMHIVKIELKPSGKSIMAMLFLPEIERERELIKALRYHVNKLDELGRVYKVAIWNEQYRYMRRVERICGGEG